MKKFKIMYYASTGLLTLLTIAGVGRYVFDHDFVAEMFSSLGYPTYLVYPMAALKSLGLVAIWYRKNEFLKNLAYSGFFWNFSFGMFAHIAVQDGGFAPAMVCLILLIVSFIGQRKLWPES